MYIIYDFKCTECDQIFERMVKRDEVDETKCDCGGATKVMPAGPITRFKFADRSAIKSKKAVSLRDKH